MFVGHLAAGFAAKRAAPRVSLGWLLAAALLCDLLWAVLLLAGLERARVAPGDTAVTPLAFDSYPFSHSLAATALLAALAGAAAYAGTRSARGATVLALAVLSHWPLDLLSHRPDLQLAPGVAARFGLGLWNSIVATLAVEGALWLAALALYARTTRARDRAGSAGFVAFAVFVTALYLAGVFGPPPPGIGAVAWSDLAGVLLILWAAWFDGHRTPL